MKVLAKPVAMLGMAGALTLMTPAHSSAQMFYDPLSHVVNPTPEGLCWIQTDPGYVKEFGYGYWGPCPPSVQVAPPGTRARAQAIKPSKSKKRSGY